jgi:hypothetical protein
MRLKAAFLISILLIQIAPVLAAKPKGDWNAVKALIKRSVAVRTKSGETHFGLMQLADDAGIEIQIAGKDDFTSQQISVRREEVKGVWLAKLRFGQKNIGKGALIGAGSGLGVAYLTALALSARDSSDPPVGLGAFPLYGAALGAVVGQFWKKSHKKQTLVYSV